MRDWTQRSVTIALLAGILSLAVAASPTTVEADGGRSGEAGIQAVRAWTSRFADPSAAVADGFTATNECVPEMGYHYVKFSRMDFRLEPSRPEALLYTDTADGERVLIGAEWIVIDRDQDLATNDDRPSLFGHLFDGPMPGHGPGMPIHYDLHAYAWLDNPNGAFATWNPNVRCHEG